MLLAIGGPRQSGKSTLCARAFADKSLGLLKSIEAREQALEDPVGFLARYPRGAVIDHAQRAPLLFPELQIDVDRRSESGRWVPTGSTHVHLHSSIRRVARRAHRVARAFATVARGTPARLRRERARGVRHQRIPAPLRPGPRRDHLARTLHHDLRRARRALRAQRRKAQHSPGHSRHVRRTRGTAPQQLRSRPDTGVKCETARARISVLEASFIVFQLRPYFRSVGKRLTQEPRVLLPQRGLPLPLARHRARRTVAPASAAGLGLREPGRVGDLHVTQAPRPRARAVLLPRPVGRRSGPRCR